MKFLLRSLIIKITQPLINFIMTSKIGRSLYFDRIPPNKMVIANTDDLDFVVNSSDKVIGKSTFVNQVPYESELLSLSIEYLHRHKKQVTTLLDIGANIGTVGLTAVKKKMVSQCIAFEPDPLNYNYLLKNILINDLNEYVSTYNVGLSNGLQDQMEFEVDRENFGDHRLRLKADNGLYEEINRRVILVKVMKLDNYYSEIPLDSSLIWMDTQGAEGLILKGANNLLQKLYQ
jgi:FkbM family methyltransferase